MKKKGVSIFALWEKAAKAKKIASTSTPNDVEIESNGSNMQLALVPAQNDGEASQFVPAQNIMMKKMVKLPSRTEAPQLQL
jgi:hypothetical protein